MNNNEFYNENENQENTDDNSYIVLEDVLYYSSPKEVLNQNQM